MSPALSVPEGYKMTEVGIIPGDWESLSLGSVAKFQRGFDLPSRLRKNGEMTLPLKNVSLAEWFNSDKENGNGKNIKSALHARIQARGG